MRNARLKWVGKIKVDKVESGDRSQQLSRFRLILSEDGTELYCKTNGAVS
ncbi:hypothetical protein H1P_320008 [Hyella patelloides LEGE 07179]|uniref:Uncharacterized protein n=1 Tax=Hyella patelloides LEGE 07179 TaxID=945734 RepID=A0A563VUX2_9CYAN|nr:hypothetical protein H1P_320008 [Hyella patelloides LEGE 07179]